MTTSAPIPIVPSLTHATAGVEALLCDIWGVLHNGVAPFPGAPAALVAFRRAAGRVVLLSNAPRPGSVIVGQLDRLGVPREAYDAIVTSGDLARRMVAERVGVPVLHLGPERDRPLFEGLDVAFADVSGCGVVVCTGLYDDTVETAETYRAMLTALAARGVPMVCANPDITVERGGSIIYCAGAVARLYGELGGTVAYAGKPHPPVYDLALDVLAGLAGKAIGRERILAVGDGLRTDIAGAHAVGIPSLFIASPIHVDRPLTADVLAELFPAGDGPRPIAAMAALV